MLGTLHTNLTESDWAASLVITLNNIGHNLSINYSWNGLVALCWILYTWTQPREGASDDNIEKSNNLKLQYNTARDQTGLLLSQTIETTRRSFEYFREGERERDREGGRGCIGCKLKLTIDQQILSVLRTSQGQQTWDLLNKHAGIVWMNMLVFTNTEYWLNIYLSTFVQSLKAFFQRGLILDLSSNRLRSSRTWNSPDAMRTTR